MIDNLIKTLTEARAASAQETQRIDAALAALAKHGSQPVVLAPKKKVVMSAAARKKISLAMKARHAALKAAKS